jgi:hypothetical protein
MQKHCKSFRSFGGKSGVVGVAPVDRLFGSPLFALLRLFVQAALNRPVINSQSTVTCFDRFLLMRSDLTVVCMQKYALFGVSQKCALRNVSKHGQIKDKPFLLLCQCRLQFLVAVTAIEGIGRSSPEMRTNCQDDDRSHNLAENEMWTMQGPHFGCGEHCNPRSALVDTVKIDTKRIHKRKSSKQ